MPIPNIETHTNKKVFSPQRQRNRKKSPAPVAHHPAAIIRQAHASPDSLTSADVLQLQRTIGNQAVGQLLAEIGRIPSTAQQAPVQRQEMPEEEELLQGKMTKAFQRQPEPEEEELLQGKFTDECIQCQELPEEEEELLQGKMIETVQRQIPEEEEELIQGKFSTGLPATVQAKRETPSNRTGMPDHLKSGIEKLSGTDLSGVRVHYNSSKPPQLNAFAYTQGHEIHVAPGQEKHLPHEGWHAVQQSQGRVKPTLQVRGVAINDDQGLEREADVMGEKSLKASSNLPDKSEPDKETVQLSGWRFLGAPFGLWKKGKKRDQINKLRADGATDAQITAMMAIEPNGWTLHAQIKAEANQSANLIHQLYVTDGATSAEITAMLAVEPNAQTLHDQIQAEAANSPTRVNQLYIDGFASARITAMLAIEPNGQTIHNLIQPVNPNFTPGNIVFASMAGGNFGSIYFTAGRIRLTHNSNPEISVHPEGITRYTISNADYAQYRHWRRARRRPNVAKYLYVMALPSCTPAVIGAGDRLFEFFGVNGAQGNHPSRGGPVAFPHVLNQIQVNILYNGANMNDNQALRDAMAIDPVLAGIPMN